MSNDESILTIISSSIAASSATVYAYLSEFHTKTKRSQVVMASCILLGVFANVLPFGAWAVINRDWEFYVPWLDVNYKPWRLFFIVCALPEMLAFIILMYLPESPKFLSDNDKPEDAYRVLQQMHRWNNGNHSELAPFEICKEDASVDVQTKNSKDSQRCTYLKSIWHQTVPLFKPPLLRSTILVCLVQFSLYYTFQGVNVFFGDIVNKIGHYTEKHANQNAMMCDVINSELVHFTNSTGRSIARVG